MGFRGSNSKSLSLDCFLKTSSVQAEQVTRLPSWLRAFIDEYVRVTGRPPIISGWHASLTWALDGVSTDELRGARLWAHGPAGRLGRPRTAHLWE